MKYLEYYEDRMNEGIFNIFGGLANKIKSLFTGEKSIEERKEELIKILDGYKNSFMMKDDISKKDVTKIINKLKNELGVELVSGINLDTFIRGIYNITIKGKSEEKINKYFNKYINRLDDRLAKLYDKDYKDSFMDDEEFAELRKLKKDAKLKISKKVFNKEKEHLQIELLKMQEWLKETNGRLAIVCEGRDAAGKGSAIKKMIEYLDPKYFKVATFGIPTEEEKSDWFKRYRAELPEPGHITFYDRSWYNRAVNDPVMGYCDENEYREFMHTVNHFEKEIINEGVTLIKLWFSIDRETQDLRFRLRKLSPLKYWKYSPNDEKTIPKWDVFTKFKEQMFQRTSTKIAPWTIVDSNDKRTAQLNVMRYILNKVPYLDKSNIDMEVYPEVIFEV